MSRSRVSLTPFDDEPDKRIADEVRIRFDYRDQRKKKDLEKLTQLSREIRDGYKGEAEVSEERDAEIMAMLARIVENRRRLRMGSKKDREIYELYRSRVVVPSNAGKSKAIGQGQTANRGMNRRTPAATRRSTHTARQNRTRGQHPAAAGATRRESERRGPLYDDIMPANGLRHLSAVDRRELGDKLLQQMNEINDIRKRTSSLKNCRVRFGKRVPFRYRNEFYIAMCPIHPDEDMDYKSASVHYRDKHCVADKRYMEREAMKYLGTKITSRESEILRYIEETRIMDQQSYTMPVIPEDEEPRRMVTLDTSAIRAALATVQPESQTTDGTRGNDITSTAAQENEVAGSNVAPLADMAQAGAISPLTEVPTENISRELAAGPELWNWTPTWLAAVREAAPEHPETNDVPGSIRNPLMVLDNEESDDSRGAGTGAGSTARDPHTPSPVRVKMQGSPSSRLRRLGVRGVQLSPAVFRSRTPAGAGPLNDAQESATQHEEEEQQQQQQPQQSSTGYSAKNQQTASPPPSHGASAHAGGNEDGAIGAVEGLTGIVNRSFTQHRFVLGI